MNLIGVDIGGTKCAVLLGRKNAGGSLEVADKRVVATSDFPDPYLMIRQLQNLIDELLKSTGTEVSAITSIGISCGGPLDSKTGMIYSPPNLPGWDSIPVTKLFSDRYGIPAWLQNDANASALAEWLMGAGRGTSNMIFLTFGTGMGGGLILNGKLYAGTNDMGGEVGHIRLDKHGPVGYGKAGSFEGFSSGGGIAQLARTIVSRKLEDGEHVAFCPTADQAAGLDTRMVALAAAAGDPVALEIIKVAATYLGQGLAILIDILNPECIVIGSIYARNENLFRPVVMEVLEREALPASLSVCTIKPAELGDSIGDFAALCVALYNDKF